MEKLIGIVLGVGLFFVCLKAISYFKKLRRIKKLREDLEKDLEYMLKGREINMPSALNCEGMFIHCNTFNSPIQLPRVPKEVSLQASGTSLPQEHQQPQKPQEQPHE